METDGINDKDKSTNDGNQRNIAPWFTASEDMILSQEVLKKYNVLFEKLGESKRSPQVMGAWKEVTASVNAVGGYSRTVENVRKRYTYLKQKVKGKASSNKAQRRKTGGGEPEIKPFSQSEELILATIPQTSISGIAVAIDTSQKIGTVIKAFKF